MLVALCGCGPSQSFRPPHLAGSQPQRELGLGVSHVGARPYVAESGQTLSQAWWAEPLAERWSLSALLAFDTGAALGGVALRWDALRSSGLAVSTEVELGLFWASASFPVAVRLWDGARLYSAPRLGSWGARPTFFAPLGVDADLFDGLSLRGEVQLSWADFAHYNRRLHSGIGIGYRWPTPDAGARNTGRDEPSSK